MSDDINKFAAYLLEQAKFCRTVRGGGVLLDVRRRLISGVNMSVYSGDPPLWQVADGFESERIASPAASGTIEPSDAP